MVMRGSLCGHHPADSLGRRHSDELLTGEGVSTAAERRKSSFAGGPEVSFGCKRRETGSFQSVGSCESGGSGGSAAARTNCVSGMRSNLALAEMLAISLDEGSSAMSPGMSDADAAERTSFGRRLSVTAGGIANLSFSRASRSVMPNFALLIPSLCPSVMLEPMSRVRLCWEVIATLASSAALALMPLAWAFPLVWPHLTVCSRLTVSLTASDCLLASYRL